MIRFLLLAFALSACAVDAEPQRYTCTVLYRCEGDVDIRARLAMPCAGDVEEANDLAADAALEALTVSCPDTWQYVRPLCAPYEGESAVCE